ncbi:MAG: Mini-ribonuclease 3 [Fastidiosipilaceae bacterium]|jgi:ribonuclease-3 family protein|nr:ribonuclease III [Clostridiaceae bacterium]
MIPKYQGDLTAVPISTLAYIGDAVYELGIRRLMLERRVTTSGALHNVCVKLVRATFQAKFARVLHASLKDSEDHIFRRGRNADPGTMAKHADPVDYRYATALETLFGYLYLTGQTERIKALLDQIIQFALAEGII